MVIEVIEPLKESMIVSMRLFVMPIKGTDKSVWTLEVLELVPDPNREMGTILLTTLIAIK